MNDEAVQWRMSLHDATLQGDLAKVKTLFCACEVNGYIKQFSGKIEECFLNACKNSHVEVVNYFLGHKALNLTMVMDDCLIVACKRGLLEVVEVLLPHPSQRGFFPDDAMRETCELGRVDVVRHLFDSCPKKDNYFNHAMALSYCKKSFPMEVLNYLIIEKHMAWNVDTEMIVQDSPVMREIFERRWLNEKLNQTLALSESSSVGNHRKKI